MNDKLPEFKNPPPPPKMREVFKTISSNNTKVFDARLNEAVSEGWGLYCPPFSMSAGDLPVLFIMVYKTVRV